MRRPILRKLKPVPENCPYCHKRVSPSFKEIQDLRVYVTERGKIVGKDRTGLCSKHQRGLTQEIKRARFLALLPFTVSAR